MSTLQEFRVIGPPGCGKTTWLKDQVTHAVEKFGADSVVVTSLTRAAARAVVKKGVPIPKTSIGTLHSLARRTIEGAPPLCLEPKLLEQWNEENPVYKITAKGFYDGEPHGDDEEGGKTHGDAILETYSALRCRMRPVTTWPSTEVRHFAGKWEAWKGDTGSIDFTDMIELALRGGSHAPGDPRFIFCDEAQDMDLLQLSLVRRWAESCEKLIIVGDPDQNLYEWRGTDPDNFLTPPIPDAQRKILSQSYRVPRAVHAVARRWIRRIKNRLDAEYLPRDADGAVRSMACPKEDPEPLVDDVEQRLEEGRSVMVLASCGYMLGPTIALLKERGIPFGNDLSPTRGRWNPLCWVGKTLSYLATDPDVLESDAGLWTWHDLAQWTSLVSVEGLLRHSAKAQIKERSKDEDFKCARVNVSDVEALFEPDALEVNDLRWLASRKMPTATKNLDYYATIAARYGNKKLLEPPRVTVGTIHSVKGGEADVVYLFLSLSPNETDAWLEISSRGCGELIRKFYVGMTRAREELVLLEQGSPRDTLRRAMRSICAEEIL